MPTHPSIIKINQDDYKLLEKTFESRLTQSGMIYNVIKLAQSLKENSKIQVAFYADSEKWAAETTTFMGLININGLPRTIVVFCGPSKGATKEAVLRILSRLDWSTELQFEGVDNNIAPVLVEEAKKHGKVVQHDPIGLYYMTKEEAQEILTTKDENLLNGPNIYGSSLRSDDAGLVQDRWPEKVPGYYEMLQASIELVSSGGIYMRHEDNFGRLSRRLVSFAVALPFGSIHAFHTEPDQRRKGYGKLTMKVLSRNIANAQRIPLVQIYKDNAGSRMLNESIGFKYSHDVNLINYSPK